MIKIQKKFFLKIQKGFDKLQNTEQDGKLNRNKCNIQWLGTKN